MSRRVAQDVKDASTLHDACFSMAWTWARTRVHVHICVAPDVLFAGRREEFGCPGVTKGTWRETLQQRMAQYTGLAMFVSV